MAGSAGNIQLEINKWDLEHVEPSSTSIANGCLLKLFTQKIALVDIRKRLECRVGLEIDDSLFRSNFTLLKKGLDGIKKLPKNEKLWGEFRQLLAAEWHIPLKRADVPKRKDTEEIATSSNTPLSKKLRTECMKCPALQASVRAVKEEMETMKKRQEEHLGLFVRDHDRQLRELEKKLLEEREVVKEITEERDMVVKECKKWEKKAKRRGKTIKRIRVVKNNALNKMKLRSRNPMDISRQLKNLRTSLAWKKKNEEEVEDVIKEMKNRNRDLLKEIRQLEICIDDLECSGRNIDRNVFEDEGIRPRMYDFRIRKVFYRSLKSKVPLAHAGEVINSAVKELCDSDSLKTPSKTTISRMVYEMSCLATVQATEALLKSESATLCWDATSLDSLHINEIHVATSDDQKFTLSIAALPGGSAADYILHVTQTVDKMAQTYGVYTGQDPVGVKAVIISKIRSTMSDRCPVNSVVTRELRELWARDLVELHCNLHPLDGFSKSICSILKKLDGEMGMRTTGRDCCASNFLYTLSKVRNKATGDPAGFTAFLKQHSISPSEIPRFVGNRWNLLFKMSHTVIKRQALLQMYIERYCKKEEMRKDLLWGILDPRLLAQFRALALIGQVITGPWMSLFYGNKDRLSNLEMVPQLQTFAANLKSFCVNPALLLTTSSDIFGQPLVSDIVLTELQDTPQQDPFLKYLSVMLEAIQKVTDNQLARYVTGELSEVTSDMLEATKASSPHNVWAERVLGMYDNLWRRSKQATTSHIECKVQSSTQNTLDWLEGHSQAEQEKVVKFAIAMGGQLRKKEMQRRRWLEEAANKRLIEAGQRRDEKMRRCLEKEIAEVMRKGDVDGMEKFKEFSELEEGVKERVKAVVMKKSLKGVEFAHDWEEEDGTTETYRGCVLSQAKRASKLVSYKVKYVLPGLEDDVSTTTLMSEKFVCDLLLGDLHFL